MDTVWTRKQYMDNECTHQQYYAQFAEPFISIVAKKHTVQEWKELLKEDKHLNNVPIKWWDSLMGMRTHIAHVNKKINGKATYSPSCVVCAAKAAVKLLIERA